MEFCVRGREAILALVPISSKMLPDLGVISPKSHEILYAPQDLRLPHCPVDGNSHYSEKWGNIKQVTILIQMPESKFKVTF